MESALRILVVGAGPVGLSMAIGLAQKGEAVTLVDEKDFSLKQSDNDQRMIALSHHSIEFFKRIQVWSAIKDHATAIQKVHVSQKNFCGDVMLSSEENGVDFLGYIAPYEKIVETLYAKVKTYDSVQFLDNTKVIADAKVIEGKVTLEQRAEKQTYAFKWVVSSEGTNSRLRDAAGIDTFIYDYNQAAVITTCQFSKPHQNIAYERFTNDGILALLPFKQDEMAVVKTIKRTEMIFWQKASKQILAKSIKDRMPNALGEITEIGKRQVWALSLMLPKDFVKGKLFLTGNSAHGLHPIAGQGLNLGLRDCDALINLLSKQEVTATMLQTYNRTRRFDAMKTVGATDFLVRIFDVKNTPIHFLRGVGLLGVRWLPQLKRKIAKFGMGY